MTLLALDFGTDTLKIAQILPAKNKTPVIEKTAILPLEYGDIGGTFTIPQVRWDTVRKQLARAFEIIGSRKKDVCVLMPDQLTKLVFLKVENVRGAGVKNDYIKWRLKKMLPATLVDGCSIDFSILGSTERQSDSGPVRDYDMVVHLIKLELIDSLATVLDELGKRLAVCDSTSVNLMALYARTLLSEKDRDDFALINIGHEVTTVNLARNGILSYQRVIEIAGRHFSELFMQFNKFPDVKTAREYMENTFHFPEFTDDHDYAYRKFDEIDFVFGRWIHEVSMTFKFYQGSHHGHTYPRMVLTGGTAAIPAFTTFLEKLFQTQVSRLDAESIATFKTDESRASQFLPLVGFAWRTI